MDGLVYLLNQSGLALAQANDRIAELTKLLESATSGKGCLRVVNVAYNDVLNLRAGASSNSRIVDRLAPDRHGILALRGPCIPASRPWAQRWCPVTHYNGNAVVDGYVKARYVRDQECP